MNVLTIGSDRNIFNEESAVRARVEKQAKLFGELHIIVFSRHKQGLKEVHNGNLHLYPTNSHSRLLYVLDAVRQAAQLRNISVISAQDPFESGLAAYIAGKRRGAPVQLQVHTDVLSSYFRRGVLNRIRLLLARFLLPRAQGVRVTTQRLQDGLRTTYRITSPINVLPVYTDPRRFSELSRAPGTGTKRLLWIGRFEPEKNPHLALRALAAARAQGVDARLVMLGAGSLESSLRRLGEELGISDHLVFPGWQSPESCLTEADLLLCTSFYEGYGLAVVEALSAGVPVLSTDVGVAKEAGATIAPLEEFIKTLTELLRGPLPRGMLRFQLMEEENYLQAYKHSLEQICA